MKQIILVIIAIICLAGEAFGQDKESIKIGMIAPLSGPFVEWGQSLVRAMEITVKDTKHSFDVMTEDSACDPKQTLTIAQKLLLDPKIKIIIGPGCVTGLRAIAPLAEKKQALLFSTGLLDDSIFKEYSSVINLATQISVEARHMAAYAAKGKIKRIAIVHGTNYFGEEYGRRLPQFLAKQGISVVRKEAVHLDTFEFRAIIARIIRSKPEAIFIHAAERPLGIFAKQLRELGSKLPILSYYSIETESILASGGTALEGLRYTHPVNSAMGTEAKLNFEKLYKEKFGSDTSPSPSSYFVYDGIMLIDKALEKCSPTNTKCLSDFVRNHGDYQGISGAMRIEKDGSNTRPFGLKVIRGRKFHWISKEIGLN